MRPSFPTTLVIRSSSRLIRSLIAMTSLKVSATLPASPVQSSGKRTEKLPRLNAVNALSNCFSSNWFSPLKREPFAGCAIDTEVVFFITNQQDGKKKLTDRESRPGKNEPISHRPWTNCQIHRIKSNIQQAQRQRFADNLRLLRNVLGANFLTRIAGLRSSRGTKVHRSTDSRCTNSR